MQKDIVNYKNLYWIARAYKSGKLDKTKLEYTLSKYVYDYMNINLARYADRIENITKG